MNIAIILGAMAFFGLAHSLTAGRPFKGRLQRVMGERVYHGTYRLMFNLLAALTITPTLLAVALLPNRALYRAPLPWSALLIGLQVAAIAGLAISALMTNLLDFTGLRQLAAMLRGDTLPVPPTPFITRGPYALVRHPLYFFSLLFLWAAPIMTLNTLLFNLGATAYFLAGTFPEEHKLIAVYGESYRAYQGRVPRLLPWPRPRPQGQGPFRGLGQTPKEET